MASYFLEIFLTIMTVVVIGVITALIAAPISAFFGFSAPANMFLMFFIFFAIAIGAGWSYDRYKEKQFFKEDDD